MFSAISSGIPGGSLVKAGERRGAGTVGAVTNFGLFVYGPTIQNFNSAIGHQSFQRPTGQNEDMPKIALHDTDPGSRKRPRESSEGMQSDQTPSKIRKVYNFFTSHVSSWFSYGSQESQSKKNEASSENDKNPESTQPKCWHELDEEDRDPLF